VNRQGKNEAAQENGHAKKMMQKADEAGRQHANDDCRTDGRKIRMCGTPDKGGNDGAQDDIPINATCPRINRTTYPSATGFHYWPE
jgi:hypothetical protein